ncbi:hypothetical protein ACFULU_39975, partial [Streptomyces sp. NPDC057284]
LADNDAAHLIGPLADTHTHLKASHPDLAARIDAITHNAEPATTTAPPSEHLSGGLPKRPLRSA